MVGPPGLEPGTKGFTLSHPFPDGADYLITLNRIVRGGTLKPVIKNTEVLR